MVKISGLYASQFYSFLLIDITVHFNPPTYSVSEGDVVAQPTLILSNPSSTNITVQVFNTDNSATGECYVYIAVTN